MSLFYERAHFCVHCILHPVISTMDSQRSIPWHLIPCLNLLPPGSTHLRDPRTTSNPSSPSSSPHTPSALGSGSSDPVLNGGLCSAAYCSSAGGRYTQLERWSIRESQSPHRGLSGSHYGIVSRCHPAVVRNNVRRSVCPPLLQLQLQLDITKWMSRKMSSTCCYVTERSTEDIEFLMQNFLLAL